MEQFDSSSLGLSRARTKTYECLQSPQYRDQLDKSTRSAIRGPSCRATKNFLSVPVSVSVCTRRQRISRLLEAIRPRLSRNSKSLLKPITPTCVQIACGTPSHSPPSSDSVGTSDPSSIPPASPANNSDTDRRGGRCPRCGPGRAPGQRVSLRKLRSSAKIPLSILT